MFGRYAVGLVLAAVLVNVLLIAFVVVQGLASLIWQKLHPDPFRAFRIGTAPAKGGWMQLVTNVLLAVALAAYTSAFIALASVESAPAYYTLGMFALLVAQATNVRTKLDQAMKRTDISTAAFAALPWAAIGAPLGWVSYLAVSVPFTYGDIRILDDIGVLLTRLALTLGDWFVVRLAAVGLLLVFAINLLMFVVLLPVAVRGLASRKPA